MEKTIWLTIVVPDGRETRVQCDSVRFLIPDGAKNKNAGGSIGIRPGHTDALMSVAAGEVTADRHGEVVLQCTVEAGLAM
ncbi:MAG: hypothetical protein IJX14_01185, partial [Clostridia bacterium]|nr:hypothetical protein [Clostridia bacterium]